MVALAVKAFSFCVGNDLLVVGTSATRIKNSWIRTLRYWYQIQNNKIQITEMLIFQHFHKKCRKKCRGKIPGICPAPCVLCQWTSPLPHSNTNVKFCSCRLCMKMSSFLFVRAWAMPCILYLSCGVPFPVWTPDNISGLISVVLWLLRWEVIKKRFR